MRDTTYILSSDKIQCCQVLADVATSLSTEPRFRSLVSCIKNFPIFLDRVWQGTIHLLIGQSIGECFVGKF